MTRLRAHWVDGLIGLAVFLLGAWEARGFESLLATDVRPYLGIALGMGLAAGLHRAAPGLALLVVWVTGTLQVVNGLSVMLVQLAAALVAFGTARWGSLLVAWASGLSIPLGGLIGFFHMLRYGDALVDAIGYEPGTGRQTMGLLWPLLPLSVGVAVLAVPWLAGMALRSVEMARASKARQVAAEADAARAVRAQEQAQEIASLREEQARLARDVHDVVGHSLAVILAQAESAQFLPDEPDRLKETMANIALAARQSLGDVRTVLSTGAAPSTTAQALDELVEGLVDGVRRAGHAVESQEYGDPRPLPPELQTVVFRVLQEMLTNALKHGSREAPVQVVREWGGHLRIEVRNLSPVGAGPGRGTGFGIDGMRQRLASVGGRLDLGVDGSVKGEGMQVFVATAWVPTRHG